MTQLFTKIVAFSWLVIAIFLLTHDSKPIPSAQSGFATVDTTRPQHPLVAPQ
jgi:hypothetical protein